jgi:hypothetical protein
MSETISFRDADGKRISGRSYVSHGMITVTASDGRTKTAEIEESMLSPETLARMLILHSPECSYFNCIRRGDRPVTPRDEARRIAANIAKAAGAATRKVGKTAAVNAGAFILS